jgi:hypothetical protein
MKFLSILLVCGLSGVTTIHAAEMPHLLFSLSSDEKGEAAVFSKKALFDANVGDKYRYGEPVDFVVDSLKIWTFEGDGERVTMYTVGIAGTFKRPYPRQDILLKRNNQSYLGHAGNAGKGAEAIKGIDELLLEAGQSYITFQLRDRDEAIAVAHELAALLK